MSGLVRNIRNVSRISSALRSKVQVWFCANLVDIEKKTGFSELPCPTALGGGGRNFLLFWGKGQLLLVGKNDLRGENHFSRKYTPLKTNFDPTVFCFYHKRLLRENYRGPTSYWIVYSSKLQYFF